MPPYSVSRLQRALSRYVLLPLLSMAVLGTLLMAVSWQNSVVQVNERDRREMGAALLDMEEEFVQRSRAEGEFLRSLGDLALLEKDPGLRASAFARLYRDVGGRGIDFYLLKSSGEPILSSRPRLPEYLLPVAEGWGVFGRMAKRRGPWQEFQDAGTKQDLIFAHSIETEGETAGCLFFVLPEDYLEKLGRGATCLVLTDALGNARMVKGRGEFTEQRKLKKEFAAREGLLSCEGEAYYVTSEDSIGGGRLYAVTEVTEILTRYAIGAGTLFLAVGLLAPFLLRSIARESRLAAESSRHLTAIAELKELESKFNPHFLFNTLENVKFMIRLDPKAAADMVMALSSLLRYSIDKGGQQVPLGEDLRHLDSYMKIQQYRFGSRLEFSREVDPAAEKVPVPKLIFQPLLENAIKYGEDETGRLRISFQVSVTGSRLQAVVRDGGRGIEPEKLIGLRKFLTSNSSDTAHHGLYNVWRRLGLMYGGRCQLDIDCPEEGGTVITLRLPLEEKEGENAGYYHSGG